MHKMCLSIVVSTTKGVFRGRVEVNLLQCEVSSIETNNQVIAAVEAQLETSIGGKLSPGLKSMVENKLLNWYISNE